MINLLYGFSLLYVISGLMGYSLKFFEILGVSIICFLFNKYILKTLKSFLIVGGIFSLFLSVITFILYKQDKLDKILSEIKEFIYSYYLFVTVDTIGVDQSHQSVVIYIIGICIMIILGKFIFNKKINYLYLIVISCLLLIGGIITGTMESKSDHNAFFLLVCTIIIYYFYNFHQKNRLNNRRFSPYFLISISFIIIIFIIANILYLINPYPLIKIYGRSNTNIGRNIKYPLESAVSYFSSEKSSIDNFAEFKNIELMKVKSNNMRYLKGNTYEIYKNGFWSKDIESSDLYNEGDLIQNSSNFKSINYIDYYYLEKVHIVYVDIITNLIFLNNYSTINRDFLSGDNILYDYDKGIYYSEDLLGKSYEYTFDAVIPRYGGYEFNNLIRKLNYKTDIGNIKNITKNLEMDKRITKLAKDITFGLNNKFDKAIAIERYLKENYDYNLNLGEIPIDADPVNHFLFESKEGFCQHFASAFVLLTRSINIPSRYATGFYIRSEDNLNLIDAPVYAKNNNGYSSVYDSDSHSWPQIYFPEAGWLMFEPTPGRSYNTPILDNDKIDSSSREIIYKKKINLNFLYIILLVLILIFIYLISKHIRKRINVNKLANEDKIVKIFYTIKYFCNYLDSGLRISEAPREYAQRMDTYILAQEEIRILNLIPDLESILYGNLKTNHYDLEKHIKYLIHIRRIMKKKMKKIDYFRMLLVEYFYMIKIKR